MQPESWKEKVKQHLKKLVKHLNSRDFLALDAKESWSKKGCWTDTTKKSHLVSSICKTRNKLVPDHIPAKKINAYYTLENKSRRIVLVSDDELELIFFLSFIDGKWYLTVIDTVSSDCSA